MWVSIVLNMKVFYVVFSFFLSGLLIVNIQSTKTDNLMNFDYKWNKLIMSFQPNCILIFGSS